MCSDRLDRPLIPSVDKVLRHEGMKDLVLQWGIGATTDAVRAVQKAQRAESHESPILGTSDRYREPVLKWLQQNRHHGYREVFNLTGTLIHTNLGRALIGEELVQRALRAAIRPVTLEFDLGSGKRGQREAIIKERLCRLTGAEDATVVNNNAAAVLLALNTLAEGREVLVSRGELIEIGGSFRLPEIMKKAYCKLVEVGTTNRTHAQDFSDAINDSTGLLLKVHPSNYAIKGFTKVVSEKKLAEIAHERQLPCIVDLGSGALVDLSRFGLPREPLPQDSLKMGADLVTFSGDKLLGGIQAGFIVGKREYVSKLNSNPLKRTLRMDKLSLAILDETLKAYEDPDSLHQQIPLFAQLSVSSKTLRHRAEMVVGVLKENLKDYEIRIEPSQSQIGSGALPEHPISSVSVQILHRSDSSIRNVAQRLRELQPPVIARVAKGSLVMDMRGAHPIEELTETLAQL